MAAFTEKEVARFLSDQGFYLCSYDGENLTIRGKKAKELPRHTKELILRFKEPLVKYVIEINKELSRF